MAGNRLLLLGTLVILSITVSALSEESPCSVVVGQHEYDFSSLAAREHWRVEESSHIEREIYLSLCHPLRNAPAGCAGNDTGVCITQVMSPGNITVTVPNAGRVSPVGPAVPRGQSMVEYVLDNGDACAVAPGETYRTSINFICTHSPEEETGPVLMSFHRCDLFFAWMTEAACPRRLDVVETTPCSIKFPSSDHMLHLQTLRAETYYSLSSAQPAGTYEINICGPVVNGSCDGDNVAVCYTPKDGSPKVLANSQEPKVRWEESTLALVYHPLNSNKGVEVRFSCDRTAADTRVNYVTQNDTFVILAARTSAVCPPTPTPSCVLDDHAGNVYDLRPLHRELDNWEALQSSGDDQEVLYHINICGPVNPASPYTCPPGLIGVCKAGIGTEASYNLGLITSHPTINTENGSIAVIYTGGDPCNEGKDSYSSRINLICSTSEHGPVLVKETKTCEYVFDWLTPVACPRHFSTGNDCQVKDPLYGNVFDLNPLRNTIRDYTVSSDEQKYFINLCGPLVTPCNGENGTSGICQVDKDQQFSAGHYTTQVTFNDGTLMMSYTNGTKNCDGNTRSSKIIFLCDHEVSGRDGPTFIGQHDCTSNFFWKTKEACPPFHVVDCTLYTAEGMMYDLHELSSSDTNLEYYTSEKKFIFNVCRSVVHQKGSRCPYWSGACITDRTYHNSSINIGEVESGPYLEDGKLMIKYSGGDQCQGHTQLYQTIIEFKCDEDATFSLPQLVAEENCTYYFELRSAAACPVSVQNTSLLHVGKECTVTSPRGYIFNLNSLKQSKGYTVKNSKNLSLTVNVCGALRNSSCPGENTGACTSAGNAGQANANLYYLPEHLSLHYTGGEKCHDNLRRSTIITFVCGAENATEGPVLVFDDTEQCIYFVTWYTELACEKRIPCFVDTFSHQIDLSPLIKSDGNYEAVNPKNPREKFYLNVCRPLNPIIDLNCQPGSAICKTSINKDEDPLSLGHPNVIPVHDGSGGANIMYTHGAKCSTVQDYNLSSMIHFICDPSAGKGRPVFKEMTHDCQYQFEWRTSVACETQPKVEDSGPQCQIRFDDAKANIDLRPLYHPQGYQVNFGNKTFTINVCGSACNDSGSCTSDGDSYGLSNKSDLKWNYGQLSLMYYGGSICNESLTGHKTTSILFECDMSKGFGFPVADELMESLNCHAVFTWRTNVTCIEGIYATEYTPPLNVSSVNGTDEQSSHLQDPVDGKSSGHSTVSTVISSIVVIGGIVLVLALLLLKTRRGNYILASTYRLFGIHGYSRTDPSQVENSTLLGPSSSIRVFKVDESDDDMLRV